METRIQNAKPSHASAAPRFFFQGADLKKWLLVALVAGIAGAILNSLWELNIQKAWRFDLPDFLRQFSGLASCGFLGLIFAEKASLHPLLLTRAASAVSKRIQLFIYGAAPGFILGLGYYRLFSPFRHSPRIPLYIRQMSSPYDTLLISLRAAVTEELVFRLFLFTAFLYILRRLFQPLMDQGFGITRWIPGIFSVLFSSLLFGVVHGTFGFVTAFLAGMALCGLYLLGGLESAILAHFVANFVFFSLTYL